MADAIQDAASREADSDWLAKYESSGPEGAVVTPMQKASKMQLGLAAAVLTGAGGVARTVRKRCPLDRQ